MHLPRLRHTVCCYDSLKESVRLSDTCTLAPIPLKSKFYSGLKVSQARVWVFDLPSRTSDLFSKGRPVCRVEPGFEVRGHSNCLLEQRWAAPVVENHLMFTGMGLPKSIVAKEALLG